MNRIKTILDIELPSLKSLTDEGRSIAKTVKIGRTDFMDKMGVASEAEYKLQNKRDGTIMFHAHVGMSTLKTTVDALTDLHRTAEQAGYSIDRAGICLDRRMGLPEGSRGHVPAETGPMLESAEDWAMLGNVVPIQPHMGDFMIGFPASTENTVNALKAGVTTIGNLSQFFAHEVPGWRDKVTTAAETIRALVVMSALRQKGTLIHSYLEDGFGAHFQDCATIAGWAYLERYIVEDLLGGKLAHCIGGLTSDPVRRVGWIFAFDEIHENDSLGSMFYGDTISFTQDFAANQGIVAEYLMWDIMAQLACPTGHAVHPLPLTEALRVPSAEEIAEAQSFSRRLEKTARRLRPHVDLSASHAFSDKVVSSGKKVFTRALDGFKDAGVDIKDPLRLLYVLKELGPVSFEELFGSRNPSLPTDVHEMSQHCLNEHRDLFSKSRMQKVFGGRRLLIASTDVHGFAIGIIDKLLSEAGAEMINLGAEKNPDDIAAEAQACQADAILISTHNGMALDYAKSLRQELTKRKIHIPVYMGGVLNQKIEDRALPVDVSDDLKSLGFHACKRLEGGLHKLLEMKKDGLQED